MALSSHGSKRCGILIHNKSLPPRAVPLLAVLVSPHSQTHTQRPHFQGGMNDKGGIVWNKETFIESFTLCMYYFLFVHRGIEVLLYIQLNFHLTRSYSLVGDAVSVCRWMYIGINNHQRWPPLPSPNPLPISLRCPAAAVFSLRTVALSLAHISQHISERKGVWFTMTCKLNSL